MSNYNNEYKYCRGPFLYFVFLLINNCQFSSLGQILLPLLLSKLMFHSYQLVPFLCFNLPILYVYSVLISEIIQLILMIFNFFTFIEVVLILSLSNVLLIQQPFVKIFAVLVQKLLVISLLFQFLFKSLIVILLNFPQLFCPSRSGGNFFVCSLHLLL